MTPTLPVHEWTGPTGVKFRDVAEPSGTYYHDTTPRAVIDALEMARATKQRVRLFLGDSKTGKGWLEEWMVTGAIGRSMGPIKVPILIPNSRSYGGPAILGDAIVRLFVGRREVYRHPGYQNPVITVALEGKYPDSPWAATVNGDGVHARFKTERAALRWAAFMRGERFSK